METARTSDTLVNFYQTTRRYNPEDGHIRTHHRENVKSYLILYAYDQVIIAESEDALQIAVNELNKIVKKYDVKISTTKTKTIGLCGKNVQRVKIELESKIIEQVSNFNYLGNLISNEEKDIKLQRYNKMNGIIKQHFGKHMTIDTKL
jgi:hypothetical protein